eukprot:CAMPEP_0119061460 /NCGR_PEP_ID=MMETSP1178-20130426/5244_1 /TAXON_ID=33656 /ORGANISM="unid sp, Strain CCMP2000" /LENGTH=240 /DNA_ID=CAMNT_0007042667 /DNA_START=1 /DNA_END=723 /DNA_ORIENTATION=+
MPMILGLLDGAERPYPSPHQDASQRLPLKLINRRDRLKVSCMAVLGVSPVRLMPMILGYVGWFVVVVSMRVAYDPLLTPTPSGMPTWQKEADVSSPKVTKNITVGCVSSSLLFLREECASGKQLWIPQESALIYPPEQKSADVVPREHSASDDTDLMLLIPLLILNSAIAFAGSRPKSRQPKQQLPYPSSRNARIRRQQFSYLHSTETVKSMRRSNSTKHQAPMRRGMATANRGALKGGF